MGQHLPDGTASPKHERDHFLKFRHGKVTGRWVRLNPPDPILYRIEPDGSRTCVSSYWPRPWVFADPLAGRPLEDAHWVWANRPFHADEAFQVMRQIAPKGRWDS